MAAARILTAIFEQDFLQSSYGYRPNLSPHDAVRGITRELQFGWYGYVAEADIKGYFDNIDHDWLLKMLEQRIDDKAFLTLIRKWLKAGILDTDGKTIHPATGTPQGGVISPVLANIYLHFVLDIWFERVVKPRCRGKVYICRFADDFICAFEYPDDAERFFTALPKRLEKFGLNLALDKSRVLPFNRHNVKRISFDFLGFEFYWSKDRSGGHHLKRRTSRKKFHASLKSFTDWIRKNRHQRLYSLFADLNAKLRGYYNYYGVIGNIASLSEFEYHMEKLLFKWLNRRSQRKSVTWESFRKILGYYKMVKPRITEQWSSKGQSLLFT